MNIYKTPLSSFWTGLFVIISLIIIVYYNTITSPFNFDDEPSIIDNKGIRSLNGILDRITDVFGRPILFISFTLNYHFGGLDPTGYHIVNIGLHIAVSILIYLIVWHIVRDSGFEIRDSKLNPKSNDPSTGWVPRNLKFLLPFLSAAIFAVHPINTESVTYIISRSSLLSTFFYLLALLMFIKANKARGKRLSSVFCLLSSFSFSPLALKRMRLPFQPYFYFIISFLCRRKKL